MGHVKGYEIKLPQGYPYATCPKCQEPVKEGQPYRWVDPHYWHEGHEPEEK